MAPPFAVAIILHEVAHGYVAERFGDPTARQLKRISLNPLVHIDLTMSIIVPAVLIVSGSPIIFGGAKPVPVNPSYFKDPRKGMLWVSAAGPATNFILALISGLLLVLVAFVFGAEGAPEIVYSWLSFSVLINLVLALFNLLPVPPLDGGRVAVGLLPEALAGKLARVEPFGLLIVIGLLFAGVFETIILPVLDISLMVLQFAVVLVG